jgi:hypothetical protein
MRDNNYQNMDITPSIMYINHKYTFVSLISFQKNWWILNPSTIYKSKDLMINMIYYIIYFIPYLFLHITIEYIYNFYKHWIHLRYLKINIESTIPFFIFVVLNENHKLKTPLKIVSLSQTEKKSFQDLGKPF